MTLLEDIKSNGKKETMYAKKGDKVNIIAEHGEVLIVEVNGVKFPVHKSKVV